MASGRLDEEKSVTEVPFCWININPFKSIYFAVQSIAAELSTATPVIMAFQTIDADVAFIIVELKVDFVKKAQSKVVFTCQDYAVASSSESLTLYVLLNNASWTGRPEDHRIGG